ncbi:hypothetical protein NHX12_020813 [Muraenolepis orangiensis]|uniref:Uncharacterized protein n=1 Tax=Muraenolepis orangiensis TaxID=630683 RepID=A0A9Q0EXS1_9TELE|nr:hypothetical protein NHX12_020813 [Muraenolepis orangiensis]
MWPPRPTDVTRSHHRAAQRVYLGGGAVPHRGGGGGGRRYAGRDFLVGVPGTRGLGSRQGRDQQRCEPDRIESGKKGERSPLNGSTVNRLKNVQLERRVGCRQSCGLLLLPLCRVLDSARSAMGV